MPPLWTGVKNRLSVDFLEKEMEKNKGGRPPKTKTRKHRIEVWFYKEEIEKIDRERGLVPRAVFVRQVLEGVKISPPIPPINIETRMELSKIGGNLNQIAKSINQGLVPDIPEIQREISKLRLSLLGIQCEQ